MAYLDPHFNPDIFVSYSHGDAGRLDISDLKAWTSKFIRFVESYLITYEPHLKSIDLFIDEKLEGSDYLSNELKENVEKSGILIIVMSKPYLLSDWCMKERVWFETQVNGHIGNPSRVMIVNAQETKVEDWPAFLRGPDKSGILPFDFYEKIGESTLPQRIDRDDARFAKAFNRFWPAIAARLKKLREKAERQALSEAARAACARGNDRLLVYLHAPWGCEEARARYEEFLSHHGIGVVVAARGTGGGLQEIQRTGADRVALARECDSMVLLRTGDKDNRFISDLMQSVQDRSRIVAARGGRPQSCAILDDTGSPLVNPKTGRRLDEDIASHGIRRFDATASNWLAEMTAWLQSSRGTSLAETVQ